MPLFRILGLLSLAVLLNACKDIDDPTPPTPTIVTADCDTYVCTFEGTGVNGDADGELGFEWSFGDGRTGVGRKIEHIYLVPDEYSVTLTAIDRQRNASSVSTEIVVAAVSDAAPYHQIVREIISDLLHIVDFHVATQTQIPALKSVIENEVSASNLPVEIQCTISGSAEISAWDDNGDLVIGENETITLTMDECRFDTNLPAIDAIEAMSLTDIDSDGNYSLDSIDTLPGFYLDSYPTKSISGNFTYAESTTLAGVYSLTAPDIIRFLRSSAITGTVLQESRFVTPAFTFTHDFSHIDGQGTLDGTTTGEWKVKILQPLSFNETADDITLVTGSFAIAQDTDEAIVTVSVDADPAYLLISVETDGDATPELEARLEQRLVTLRANEY